ncbi:hypothetical protein TSUD_220350 [Trifolium subterraneum]|uniref:Uncharacterized protein n=1 Tax=Trifolium subterraneum TaxID=3900 RepID=A0A2Z6NSJ8_TRISU|nr:hypothetical protein TSUD_220350 [Trifolium subterraneum]
MSFTIESVRCQIAKQRRIERKDKLKLKRLNLRVPLPSRSIRRGDDHFARTNAARLRRRERRQKLELIRTRMFHSHSTMLQTIRTESRLFRGGENQGIEFVSIWTLVIWILFAKNVGQWFGLEKRPIEM